MVLSLYLCEMILVTGGTGFIGAHLLLHLTEKGKLVRAIYRSEEKLVKTKDFFAYKNALELFDLIEWVYGDVNDIPTLDDAMQGITQVYHVAGFISFDAADEPKMRKVNIEGTANVVNCALYAGVKKLCYFSSIAALGDALTANGTIDETTPWNPELFHSDYAITKHGGEMEVWRGQQEGLEVIILNPGVVLGNGYWNSGSVQLFEITLSGNSYYTHGQTGFIAVEDVVHIAHKLMVSTTHGEQFILIAENIPYVEILHTAADALDCSYPQTYAAPWMTSLGWRLDWLGFKFFGKPRRLTKANAIALHSKSHYNNKKLSEFLPYHYRPVIEYLKENARNYLKLRSGI